MLALDSAGGTPPRAALNLVIVDLGAFVDSDLSDFALDRGARAAAIAAAVVAIATNLSENGTLSRLTRRVFVSCLPNKDP